MTVDRRQSYWDRRYQDEGHTGYSDPLLHRYDQPLRLAAVRRAIFRRFPEGLHGRRALDIGCGTGDFVQLHRTLGAACVGVDISPLVIEGTRDRFRDDPEVTLQAGTIVEADLPPEGFDVITSVTVLQHVLDDVELERSLAKLRDSLQPDGVLILLELMPPWEEVRRLRSPDGTPYIVERPPEAWTDLLGRAGLRVLEEPRFPQLGIAGLRGLAAAVLSLRRPGGPPSDPLATAPPEADHGDPGRGREAEGEAPPAAPNSRPTPLRRLRGLAGTALRRGILAAAYPFDHLASLPFPPRRFRHYGIYLVGRTE